MPVIQGRTRQQLRVDIGYNLGHPFETVEADATGTTTTFITDDIVLGGTGEHRGKWLVFTSGTNDGSIRRVQKSAATDGRTTLVYYPATSAATADGDTAELWNEEHDPDSIHAFINQAIIEATGQVYDPIEDITLHADDYQMRFDIPSNISMIQQLQFRYLVDELVIQPQTTFDETDNFTTSTQVLDDDDYKRTRSLKITITAASDGQLISDSISAVDLSGYDYIEGWVKSTTALAAADFRVLLGSSTVTGSGDLETLDVPATTADVWQFFRVALSNPETDTAIVSIGFEYNANAAANTVWFSDIKAVKNDRARWVTVPKHLWWIDKPNRDLILSEGGKDTIGYSLMKIVGGDKPALLTADSDTTEIDDTYIIQYVTGLELLHEGGGGTTDPSEKFKRGQFWMAMAQKRKQNFPFLTNVRHVD